MGDADGPATWTRDGVQAFGFQGFVPFAALPGADVPREPGVYCVIRPSTEPPMFLEISPAGHFKGRDPTVGLAELKSLWVPGAHVVYIGKANLGVGGKRGLRKRLDEFRAFGAGRPAGHSGGRRIWQLTDSAELLVGWMPTPDGLAASTERQLLDSFTRHNGRLPFANMR